MHVFFFLYIHVTVGLLYYILAFFQKINPNVNVNRMWKFSRGQFKKWNFQVNQEKVLQNFLSLGFWPALEFPCPGVKLCFVWN